MAVLLSDRDIRAEIAAGRVALDPFDETLLQPSSVDLRLDRHFRTFNNHAYTHIDPALQQDDLTRMVEPPESEAFVLHPGEFVLGSTYEVITLPDDIAGRLEGKALAVDTPIPTPSGWTTMGEVRVGDEVFGPDGCPRPVVAVSEVMLGRPCFDVQFCDGETITADASHQWRTTTRAARTHRDRPTVVTTATMARTRLAGGQANHHVELAAALRCPDVELPVDPYVLGARLGGASRGTADDGSLARTRRDPDLPEQEHLPRIYLRAGSGQRLALLHGLMDTTGDLDAAGCRAFVTEREELADGVFELAAGLGLRPVQRKAAITRDGIETGVAHRVEFTPPFECSRHSAASTPLRPGGPEPTRREVTGVQPVASRPVRCLQVGADDGMFLAGRGFVPTHNSSLGRLGLLTHSTAGFIDPGFSGHVTLELSNVANLPIRLWPGMKVGQLCLFRLSSPSEHPYGSPVYGSRYQDQRGPTPSRSYLNFRRGL